MYVWSSLFDLTCRQIAKSIAAACPGASVLCTIASCVLLSCTRSTAAAAAAVHSSSSSIDIQSYRSLIVPVRDTQPPREEPMHGPKHKGPRVAYWSKPSPRAIRKGGGKGGSVATRLFGSMAGKNRNTDGILSRLVISYDCCTRKTTLVFILTKKHPFNQTHTHTHSHSLVPISHSLLPSLPLVSARPACQPRSLF